MTEHGANNDIPILYGVTNNNFKTTSANPSEHFHHKDIQSIIWYYLTEVVWCSLLNRQMMFKVLAY